MRAELAVAEALAHRELGDRSRAMAELGAISDAPADTMVFCRVLAMAELAQAHLDRGDTDAARHMVAATEALVDAESLGTDVRGWLARVGTVVALAGGEHEAARQWADQVDDPFWRGVGHARVQLAAGDRTGAAASLDTSTPRCVRHHVVVAVLATHAAADRDEAMTHASAAVELASGCGLLQTVSTEGAAIIELVEQAAWRAPEEWLDRLRRSTAETRDRRPPSGASLIGTLSDASARSCGSCPAASRSARSPTSCSSR